MVTLAEGAGASSVASGAGRGLAPPPARIASLGCRLACRNFMERGRATGHLVLGFRLASD
jgi:hypothetical protein